MNALNELTPFDKVKAIFELFPQEITPFLDFMEKSANVYIKLERVIRFGWQHPQFSYDEFMSIINETQSNINLYKSWNQKTIGELSGLLTHGDLHVWTAHCLHIYANLIKNNKKLKYAVDLFFDAVISSQIVPIIINPSLN